jgi:hypothetical protein
MVNRLAVYWARTLAAEMVDALVDVTAVRMVVPTAWQMVVKKVVWTAGVWVYLMDLV